MNIKDLLKQKGYLEVRSQLRVSWWQRKESFTKYRIAGKFGWIRKFGEFGKSRAIRQTKPSKFLLTIITFWLNPFIHQTFFCQMLKMSKFAKLYSHQTFLLYGSDFTIIKGMTQPIATYYVFHVSYLKSVPAQSFIMPIQEMLIEQRDTN